MGIQDSILKISHQSDTLYLNIKDLFIFNINGIQLSHVQFNKDTTNELNSDTSTLLLKKFTQY